MPFIDSKVTTAISPEQELELVQKLGQAISIIPGKSESWLMTGFEPEYRLYFQGNQDADSAFIEVKVFGGENKSAFSQLTAEICSIFHDVLSIPKDRIYVKYEAVSNWGFNGSNF